MEDDQDIVRADKKLMLCHHKEHMLLTQYEAEFKSHIAVIEGAGGYPDQHEATEELVADEQQIVLKAASDDKLADIAKVAVECYLAVLLFDGISNTKYAELKTHVANCALEGIDSVPKSFNQVLKLAKGWPFCTTP